MKRGSGTKSRGFGNKRTGRPFGETTSLARGKGKLMTRYTRASGGTHASMKITGRKARSNGVKLLKGMAAGGKLRGAWGN